MDEPLITIKLSEYEKLTQVVAFKIKSTMKEGIEMHSKIVISKSNIEKIVMESIGKSNKCVINSHSINWTD